MTPLDLTLIFFFILSFLNYRAQCSVLYPPFIFCAMWLLDLAVARSGLIEIDPLHGNTLAIVATGATLFSIGGLLAGLVPRQLLRIHLFSPKQEKTPHSLRNILMILLLCGLPVMFHQVSQLGSLHGGGSGILMQAREAQIEAAESGTGIHSLVLDYFAITSIFVSLLFATETRNRQFWCVTAIAFIACILSTGRTNLLLLISSLSAIRLLQMNQESLVGALRLLRWPVTLFIALYIGLIFSNKNTEGMTGGVSGIATYFVLSYIVGPLAAFDRVVQHPADFAMASSHTFGFPLRLAAGLHLTDYTSPPTLDNFVFVPFPTNVYTVFKFYFLELGIIGCLIVFFIVGLLHSLLYLKARQRGRFSVYLFAFTIYAVLIVIFDDAYYTTGLYLRAIIFGLLYFSVGSVPFRLFPLLKARRRSSGTLPFCVHQ